MTTAIAPIADAIQRQNLPNVKEIKYRQVYGGGGLLIRLDSGKEISIIRHGRSYGGASGLFEMAFFGGEHDSQPNAQPIGWLDAQEAATKAMEFAVKHGAAVVSSAQKEGPDYVVNGVSMTTAEFVAWQEQGERAVWGNG